MKKRLIVSLIILFVLIACFVIYKVKNHEESNLTTIKVAEVTHSLFYAPFYVAIENGYFEDYGIDIDLILTSGADKVTAAVLSNDVQIGFCGPEATVYVYAGGQEDYIQSFAGLTKRDGQFIVSRYEIEDFSLEDLIGSEILVGRAGGMPELNFETALSNADIDVNTLNLNTSVEFAALSGTFIGGVGDFVNLFEPNATLLEEEGYGYIVASVGQLSDEVPYTAFNARKSYIENNEQLISNFTKALDEGLKFVMENDAQTIASALIAQFSDTSLDDATTIIQRYKDYDTWLENTYISQESFQNLTNILLNADLIDDEVPYNDLINNFHEE